MKNEVRYTPDVQQPVHGLYSRAESRTPLDEVMDGEAEEEISSREWLLGEVVEYCLADARPWDWRYVGERLRGLARAVAPGMAWELAKGGKQVDLCGDFPAGNLRCVKEATEDLRRLLKWLSEGRRNHLKEAAMKVYLLARGVRPERLRREDGREMVLEDFAEAFGEERQGGRARWSWRARKFLQGLPQMEWQQKQMTKERCREKALERYKKEKKGKTQ